MQYTRTTAAAIGIALVAIATVQTGTGTAATEAAEAVETVEAPAVPQYPWHADYPASTEIAGATVYAETAGQVADAEWALGRFAAAGLDLPDVELWLAGIESAIPQGNGFVYGFHREVAGRSVVFNSGSRFVLLHELGHVWDDHALTDADRGEFLEIRDADAWHGEGWAGSGAEHLANVIAWGLSEEEIRPSRTLPNDDASLQEAFILATGSEPIEN